MDFENLFKNTKKLNAKQFKKFGFWGLIIGLAMIIFVIIAGLLLLGSSFNLLNDIFNFSALGQSLKDFINGFLPGFVK